MKAGFGFSGLTFYDVFISFSIIILGVALHTVFNDLLITGQKLLRLGD